MHSLPVTCDSVAAQLSHSLVGVKQQQDEVAPGCEPLAYLYELHAAAEAAKTNTVAASSSGGFAVSMPGWQASLSVKAG